MIPRHRLLVPAIAAAVADVAASGLSARHACVNICASRSSVTRATGAFAAMRAWMRTRWRQSADMTASRTASAARRSSGTAVRTAWTIAGGSGGAFMVSWRTCSSRAPDPEQASCLPHSAPDHHGSRRRAYRRRAPRRRAKASVSRCCLLRSVC